MSFASKVKTPEGIPIMLSDSQKKVEEMDPSILELLALSKIHISETDLQHRYKTIINFDCSTSPPETWIGKTCKELQRTSDSPATIIEIAEQMAMDSHKTQTFTLTTPLPCLPKYECADVNIVPVFTDPTIRTDVSGAATIVVDRSEHTKKLEKLNECLIKASQAKMEFLSMMSHEIRTPLNGIIGMVQLLSESIDEKTSEQKEYISLIQRSSETLLFTIDRILQFLKLDSGKESLHCDCFDLTHLISDAIQICQKQANVQEHQNKFVVNYETPLWKHFYGDSIRLFQIILNLLVNANKFTQMGSITVSVTKAIPCPLNHDKSERETESECVLIVIKDTGIGMSKEFLEHVFQPFHQQEKHKKMHQGGTGLGLSICKKMINMLGGHIEISSQEGQGTKISIYLHLLKADEQTKNQSAYLKTDECSLIVVDTDESKKEKEKEKEKTEHKEKQKMVLIAEDNEVNLKVLQYLLSKLGMNYVSTKNGKECIDIFFQDHSKFGIIFIDCFMPVMDGCEATAAIRAWESKDPKNGHIPIVATTADVMQDYRKMGMDEIMTKPIDIKLLKNILKQFKLLP